MNVWTFVLQSITKPTQPKPAFGTEVDIGNLWKRGLMDFVRFNYHYVYLKGWGQF